MMSFDISRLLEKLHGFFMQCCTLSFNNVVNITGISSSSLASARTRGRLRYLIVSLGFCPCYYRADGCHCDSWAAACLSRYQQAMASSRACWAGGAQRS
jgi:hypothetical protein